MMVEKFAKLISSIETLYVSMFLLLSIVFIQFAGSTETFTQKVQEKQYETQSSEIGIKTLSPNGEKGGYAYHASEGSNITYSSINVTLGSNNITPIVGETYYLNYYIYFPVYLDQSTAKASCSGSGLGISSASFWHPTAGSTALARSGIAKSNSSPGVYNYSINCSYTKVQCGKACDEGSVPPTYTYYNGSASLEINVKNPAVVDIGVIPDILPRDKGIFEVSWEVMSGATFIGDYIAMVNSDGTTVATTPTLGYTNAKALFHSDRPVGNYTFRYYSAPSSGSPISVAETSSVEIIQPNLVASSFTYTGDPAVLGAGDTVIFTGRVTNDGNAHTNTSDPTGFVNEFSYQFDDNIIEVPFKTINNPGLSENGEPGYFADENSDPFVIPRGGHVFFRYCVDTTSVIYESSGADNCQEIETIVKAPDLKAQTIVEDSSPVYAGRPVTFDGGYQNVGDADTVTGFKTRFSYFFGGVTTTEPKNVVASPLASLGSGSDTSDPITFAGVGPLRVEFCVDVDNEITYDLDSSAESNCSYKTFTVELPPYPDAFVEVCDFGGGNCKNNGGDGLAQISEYKDITSGQAIEIRWDSPDADVCDFDQFNGTIGNGTSAVGGANSGTDNSILEPSDGNGTEYTVTCRNTVGNSGTPKPGSVGVTNGTVTGTECSDGVDNTDSEDTLVDMADPGCISPLDNDERNACNDGVDNTDPEDTLVDMADPGCISSIDNDETDSPSSSGTHDIIVPSILNKGDTTCVGGIPCIVCDQGGFADNQCKVTINSNDYFCADSAGDGKTDITITVNSESYPSLVCDDGSGPTSPIIKKIRVTSVGIEG